MTKRRSEEDRILESGQHCERSDEAQKIDRFPYRDVGEILLELSRRFSRSSQKDLSD